MIGDAKTPAPTESATIAAAILANICDFIRFSFLRKRRILKTAFNAQFSFFLYLLYSYSAQSADYFPFNSDTISPKQNNLSTHRP
jgi:cytosine/uracil/thiamine/allantoin permease